jgi:hypothetical protein
LLGGGLETDRRTRARRGRGQRREDDRGATADRSGRSPCNRRGIVVQEAVVLKILAWLVAIIFIVGLLTVTGVLKLVF